jgi:carbon starvation protein
VLPELQMPALSRFVDGSGLIVAGKVFPFCFITIACGSISGFHTLIASGTTPKMITRESYARPIGYGAMCLESLVAIMALIAACTLEPGVYLSMNVKGEAAVTAAKVTSLGYPVTVEQMDVLAKEVGEKTLFGRTGGAATLAVGMAHIFSKAVSGRWLDLWYHFAIMFEALFILTTLDAGTRVGRYILQDFLGNLWKPLGDTKRLGPNLLASGLMVCGWGYFLVQGVRDPLGGINSLWPLFGIANQMLAAIALCLATTIILKMQLTRSAAANSAFHRVPTSSGSFRDGVESVPTGQGCPWYALVTLLPLVWLVAVTFTAGVKKISSNDVRIGFLAQAGDLRSRQPALARAVEMAQTTGDATALATAEKALKNNRTLHFNNVLDAGVAAAFLALVSVILVMSIAEWLLLLSNRKPARLHESPPVWLPDAAIAEGRPLKFLGLFALLAALARELSGEADLDRARQTSAACACPPDEHSDRACVTGISLLGGRQRIVLPKSEAELYVEMTERRFNGVKRCC